jgi:hypothetical protein
MTTRHAIRREWMSLASSLNQVCASTYREKDRSAAKAQCWTDPGDLAYFACWPIKNCHSSGFRGKEAFSDARIYLIGQFSITGADIDINLPRNHCFPGSLPCCQQPPRRYSVSEVSAKTSIADAANEAISLRVPPEYLHDIPQLSIHR